jgi:hypothetical protein
MESKTVFESVVLKLKPKPKLKPNPKPKPKPKPKHNIFSVVLIQQNHSVVQQIQTLIKK